MTGPTTLAKSATTESKGRVRVELQCATALIGIPDQGDFQRWALAALADRADAVELVVRIVDEAESEQLNRTYRKQAAPTNVLSFPFAPPPGVETPLLGDLVICAPVVRREALEQGKPEPAHWAHMLVHGILHLCGHDHEDDQDALAMESLEREILARLGYASPYEE